jgi:hypothetical protein
MNFRKFIEEKVTQLFIHQREGYVFAFKLLNGRLCLTSCWLPNPCLASHALQSLNILCL